MRINRLAVAGTLAILTLAAVEPAKASPTAVWNSPLGQTTAAGNLHAGVYTFLTANRTAMIQNALTFGLLPGLELGGVTGVGAAEVGIDTYGSNEVYNGKLQLMSEGELLPAMAVGGFSLFSNVGASENILYASMTKQLSLGGFSLGTWTAGGFNSQVPGSQWGGMVGMSYLITGPWSFSADYVSGTTTCSGATTLLSYAVAPNVFLSVGHYFPMQSSNNELTFVAVDMDIPTGLWGQ